jgi:hypothetical protein
MSLFDDEGKLKGNKLEGLVDNLPSAGLVGDGDAEPSGVNSSLDESLVNDIGFIAAGQTAGNALGSSGTTSAPSAGAAGAAAIAGGTAYALEDDIADEGPEEDNTSAPDAFAGAGAEEADRDLKRET